MDYKTIKYETEGMIGILTYNRPGTVNALNTQMVNELIDFWRARNEDHAVRVIITRGAGEKGFSSGVDLKEVVEKSQKEGGTPPDRVYYDQTKFALLYRLMRACPQPIIAAVHGPAMGAGLSFALASDIRLASEDAMFCAQYINIGLGGADLGSSYFLWRIVGWGKAAEMCLTGKRFYAEEALRIGLVNYVYPKEKLMHEAMEIAMTMASKSKMALHLTKEALNSSLNGISLEDAMRIEDRNQALMAMMGEVDTEIKR